LRFGDAIRVVVVLDPVIRVLALGPLVLLVQHACRVQGRVLNDGVVVGAAAARIGRHVVVLAVKPAVTHGLRSAKGRARDIGHHAKLAHRADVAIPAIERKSLGANAGHGVQTRIATTHGLAL
jgi:hypothetical protein